MSKRLSDALTAEEEKALNEWIDSDPSNLNALKEAEEIWTYAGENEVIYTPDTPRKWNELKHEILYGEEKKESVAIPLRSTFSTWYKIAAALVLVAGLGYMVATRQATESPQVAIQSEHSRQTQDNMDVFYLPDSSIVYLNKHSKLSYPLAFDQYQRTVTLEGEAFFKVRRDELRPFVIIAGETRTEVLGTSFGLKAYKTDKEIEMVVATGKVAFSRGDSKVILEKEDKGTFEKESGKLSRGKNTDATFLSWIEDKKAFSQSEIMKLEKTKAMDYLHNESTWRLNKIHQTIVEGKISNSASFTTYSNIKMKVLYFNKANEQVGEKYFTINETIPPGHTVSYRQGLPDWLKNTKSVRVEIEKVISSEEN